MPTKDPTSGNIELEDDGEDPAAIGHIRLNGGAIKAMDATGIFDLRSGSGLSEAAHRSLDTLIHELAEDFHVQITKVSGKVSNVTVWEDNTETKKIREAAFTRSAGKVSQVVITQYDAAGAAITGETLTLTLNRISGKVDSVDGVLT